jgi:hypothetical protein
MVSSMKSTMYTDESVRESRLLSHLTKIFPFLRYGIETTYLIASTNFSFLSKYKSRKLPGVPKGERRGCVLENCEMDGGGTTNVGCSTSRQWSPNSLNDPGTASASPVCTLFILAVLPTTTIAQHTHYATVPLQPCKTEWGVFKISLTALSAATQTLFSSQSKKLQNP